MLRAIMCFVMLLSLAADPASIPLGGDSDMTSNLSGCTQTGKFSVWALRQNTGTGGNTECGKPILWNVVYLPIGGSWSTLTKVTLNVEANAYDCEGLEILPVTGSPELLAYVLNEGGSCSGVGSTPCELYRMDIDDNVQLTKWNLSSVTTLVNESSGLGSEGLAILYHNGYVRVFIGHQQAVSGQSRVFEFVWSDPDDFEKNPTGGTGIAPDAYYVHYMPYSESNSCSISERGEDTPILEVMHDIPGTTDKITFHDIGNGPGELTYKGSSHDMSVPFSAGANVEGHGIAWKSFADNDFHRRFWAIDGDTYGLYQETP